MHVLLQKLHDQKKDSHNKKVYVAIKGFDLFRQTAFIVVFVKLAFYTVWFFASRKPRQD